MSTMSQIYTPRAGEEISHSCREAVALAKKTRKTVFFTFNDIKLRAVSNSTPESLYRTWQRKQKAASAAYHKSPAYLAEKALWEQRLAKYRATVEADVKRLPKVLKKNDITKVVRWFKSFGSAGGWRGVGYDGPAIAEAFKAAGFVANEYVGNAPDWFNTRERKGRYIVGQFLGCLENSSPWPDILVAWCEEFEEMPK